MFNARKTAGEKSWTLALFRALFEMEIENGMFSGFRRTLLCRNYEFAEGSESMKYIFQDTWGTFWKILEVGV